MLLGLLLPDPCDEDCPDDFKGKARELLPQVVGNIGQKDLDLRHALLKFIGDFANWDYAANATYLDVSRGLVKAAHQPADRQADHEPPLVVDPFAGGGSIPLEALRLGCEAFASDLNPVACLLCKVLLEDAPRHDGALYESFLKQAERLKEYLARSLKHLYGEKEDFHRTAAYLWARIVQCEFSNCGAHIPLLRTLWLSRKGAKQYALRLAVTRSPGKIPEIQIEVFQPLGEGSVSKGTIAGGKVTCPACDKSMSRVRVEAQLRSVSGGTDSSRLVAVMVAEDDVRQFLPPTPDDLRAWKLSISADNELAQETLPGGASYYPSEAINSVRPSPNARGLSAVTRYGMSKFADCHLGRQRVALARIISFIREELPRHSELERAVVRTFLILLGRCVDRWSSCCRLDSTRDSVTGSFSKQALQMVWDFCEASPFSDWSGGLNNAAQWVAKVIERTAQSVQHPGQVQLADARRTGLPEKSSDVWFTDPPYYDSVPYSDLSDFFFCWLRRANTEVTLFRDPFDVKNPLTPKVQECVWNRSHSVDGRPKDAEFFERCVGDSFAEGARILKEGGTGCIVFAHKSTEGWEALLRAIVQAGLVITASWPIQTEMKSRTAARDAASLMGSIHLVCRPRPSDAPIGDWTEVLRELTNRIGDWMERLSAEGVRGADLVFACIGPAMEVYSRYSKVEDAEGREITLGGDPTSVEPYKRGFLAYVWEIVGRTALGQILGTAEARARNGGALSAVPGTAQAGGALEEDARLTALFLWTLQSTNGEAEVKAEAEEEEADDSDVEEGSAAGGGKKKGYTLIYDVARRFAQPLGIHLDLWEGRIIETEKGIVRLLPVAERAKLLFGEEGASAVADRIEANPKGPIQTTLFSEDYGAVPEIKGGGRGRKAKKGSGAEVPDEHLAARRDLPAARQAGATTLDRLHAAMLLQAGGRANALRALLKAEQERGPDFLRLANALSALYPKDSDEKRLLDAMLLAVPRR